jgi:hypothetical protein
VREILRLLLLIIIGLPLILILAGPLLVVAAIRGSQAVGPIVLSPGHNRPSGRLTALVLGAAIWIIIWGGTGMLLAKNVPAPNMDPPTTAAAVTEVPSPSPTPPAPSSPAPAQISATAMISPTSLPSAPPTAATETEALLTTPPEAAPSPTLQAEPSPPATTLTPSPQLPTPSPTPTVPVSPAERGAAIAAIEQANELLRLAVAQPTADNLEALQAMWTEEALARAQEFAREPSLIVGKPTEVSYAHLMPPVVQRSVVPEHLTVSVIEVWTYSGPKDQYTESFEFFYTLSQQSGEWRIANYSYIDAVQDGTDADAPSRYRPVEESIEP